MKKKDKIKNVDNDLYQRVDSIIKNKSVLVDDYLNNKKIAINHLKNLTEKMKNMSSDEIKKMVKDDLKKNKE
jgi:DNA replication initiation complex subunit (GINS family)